MTYKTIGSFKVLAQIIIRADDKENEVVDRGTIGGAI